MRVSPDTGNADKACIHRLYRHLRTFGKIIKNHIKFSAKTVLFRGSSESETEKMLQCLGAFSKDYDKGEIIYHGGEIIEWMGLVLSGSIHIEFNDVWGNKSLLHHVKAGGIFAETYACIPGRALMVNAAAVEKTEVLFLNTSCLMQTCQSSCAYHHKLIKNLLLICAQKNLSLSKRILHTTSKSIRGRLLSYFSEQAMENGSYSFTLPYNRQQLADYLGVDRSAMSNELSKMRGDGIISYVKNDFVLLAKSGNLMPQTSFPKDSFPSSTYSC